MRYRIDILRNYVPIGTLQAESCSITYNSDAEIKRSASITCNTDFEFNRMSDRISPVIIEEDGSEHREGVFMMISSPTTYSGTHNSTTFELYDESYILAQSAFDSRRYYPAGTLYTTVFNEILGDCSLTRLNIDASNSELQIDREFPLGANILQSLNELLSEAGYDTLHMDGDGYAICALKKDKSSPEFIYRTDSLSTIQPGVTSVFDIYGIPNVFVGVVSTPDQEVMKYTAENHNLNSDLSIERRGYKLTKVYTLDSVASEQELAAYVERLLNESMMAVEGINFTTGVEAGHGFQNCVQVEHENITGLFIAKRWSYSFETGASMNHYAEKRVFV